MDALYMEAVQAIAGQGGWPMTVVMTPEGEPFLAGTYFPPIDRDDIPGSETSWTQSPRPGRQGGRP